MLGVASGAFAVGMIVAAILFIHIEKTQIQCLASVVDQVTTVTCGVVRVLR